MNGQARAFSIDGRMFEFEAPIGDVLPLGGFVEISTDAGAYLGQVVAERAAALDPAAPRIAGSGVIVGAVGEDGTVSSSDTEPFGGATMTPAGAAAVGSHLARGKPGLASLDIGYARPYEDVHATLQARGFTRHTFMCGQSGSGKTYAMGVVLERLLAETDLRIVVLDPNSDYVNLGRLREASEVGVPEEAQARTRERLTEIGPRVQVFGGDGLPIRVMFGRLTVEQQAMVLGLDPLDDAEEYDVARRIVRDFGSSDYSLGDLRDRAAQSEEPAARKLRLRIENLGLLDREIWAPRGEDAIGDLLAEDWRALVFDLGSLSSATERSIITAAVLATLWEQRRERQPLLLVVDEAHNVCPQDPTDSSQAMSIDHMIAIAGEGRKFGLYLMLATQRPQKVHTNVLTQCGNLLLMKMNAVTDVRALVDAFSFVPPGLIEMSPGFGLGEGIAAGPITAGPMLFKTGERYTPEGGADVPLTWAQRH
jgi:DNA helicase HerA-like ATPase